MVALVNQQTAPPAIRPIAWTRLLVVLFLVLATQLILHSSREISRRPILRPLTEFPRQLGTWEVRGSHRSAADVVAQLGMDEYINLDFSDTAGRTISLYVAYYGAIGNGSGYHSPKNCLPGGGWRIHASDIIRIPGPGNAGVPVNRLTIANRQERQSVLYWYQNRGRIIASEYQDKIYLVLDALLRGRRDGAFVRIMSTSLEGAATVSETELQGFATGAMAELTRFLPGARP